MVEQRVATAHESGKRKMSSSTTAVSGSTWTRSPASQAECMYLCSGAESDVYRISGTPSRILRTGARREAYARDAAVAEMHPQNVPVPEVYEVGVVGVTPYCISEELPGIPYASASHAEQLQSCGAVVGLLDHIHEAGRGRSGFGPLDATGTGIMPSWEAWMSSPGERRAEGLGDGLRNDIMEQIALRAPRACPEHALVHGDYGWSNTLVHDGEVTGVVDWSTSMYGDPLYDGGRMFLWSTWVLPCIRSLWDEYCARHGSEDRFWDRIYASALRSAVRDDADTMREHAKELLPWVRGRAEVLLAEWKGL